MYTRIQRKGKRKGKYRYGEYVCTCSAYNFPHRFTGGKCTGRFLARNYWNLYFGSGTCETCNCCNSCERTCNVLDGTESVEECEVWQEFVDFNEIKVTHK